MVVRKVASYGLSNALRVTVGSEEACRKLVDVLTAFLRGPA